MYYVFDGAEMYYFNSRFLARLFYEVGFANDHSPFASLWELGFEDVRTGFGCFLESKWGCVSNA